MRNEKSSTPSFLFLSLLAFTGFALLHICTAPWGIGANSDSANYIAGAQNLLNGNGYVGYGSSKPLTQWPPFFSLTLAIPGFFGLNLLEGARMINTMLFGLNILAVGLILKKLTRSTILSLAGAGLMLTSTAMINIHSMALSEPWFIFLTLMALFFLSQYLGGRPVKYLIFASIFTAMAALDRYDGISLIGAGLLIILLLHQEKFSVRLNDGLWYALISSFPLGLFFLRNYFLSQNLANRNVQFHFPSPDYFVQALDTVSRWFIPERIPEAFRYSVLFFLLAVLLIVAILVIRQEVIAQTTTAFSPDDSLRLAASLAVFAVAYAGLQLAHLLFIHVNAAANDRHFAPFFVSGLLSSLILIHRFLTRHSHRFLKAAAFCAFIILGLVSLWNSCQTLISLYRDGSDRTARVWRTSPTVARVQKLPADALIYANDPYIIYLITERPAELFPRKYQGRRHLRDPDKAKSDPKLESRLDRVNRDLTSGGAYIVFFNDRHRWFNLSREDIQQSLPVSILAELSDGVIYQGNPNAK